MSFSENDRDADGKAVPVWFALAEDRPLAFFAGLCTPSVGKCPRQSIGRVALQRRAGLTSQGRGTSGPQGRDGSGRAGATSCMMISTVLLRADPTRVTVRLRQ